MPRERGVLAVFTDPAAAGRAVEAARAAGHADVRVAMPAPFPEVMNALAQPRSFIYWLTLSGAVAGFCLGVWLTVGTSLALPMHVGGKPVVALPGYIVVVFELTVLVGGLCNFLGMLAGALLARRKGWMPEDPRFTRDRIGLFLPAARGGARELLARFGAEEVRDVP